MKDKGMKPSQWLNKIYEIVILAGVQGMKHKTHESLQGQREITLL